MSLRLGGERAVASRALGSPMPSSFARSTVLPNGQRWGAERKLRSGKPARQPTYSRGQCFRGSSAERRQRELRGKQRQRAGRRRREKPELKRHGRGAEGAERRGGEDRSSGGAHAGGSWGQRSLGPDPGMAQAPSGAWGPGNEASAGIKDSPSHR